MQREVSKSQISGAPAFRGAEVLGLLADPMVAFDRQWRYSYVSRRAAQSLGKTPREMVGRSMWELFPEDIGAGFQTACERAWAERTPISVGRYANVLNACVESCICPFEDGAVTEWRETPSGSRPSSLCAKTMRGWRRSLR